MIVDEVRKTLEGIPAGTCFSTVEVVAQTFGIDRASPLWKKRMDRTRHALTDISIKDKSIERVRTPTVSNAIVWKKVI